MNLEIHDPEPAQRVQAQIQSGQFMIRTNLLKRLSTRSMCSLPPPCH
jgi:hypothetical protein